MKILWFTWKDKTHPLAGGAELMNEELAKRLVKDGHEVILLVGGYKNSKKEEIIDGYTIIRLGNRFTVYVWSMIYYLKSLKHWPDLIIEEINTIPFMTQWYTKSSPVILSERSESKDLSRMRGIKPKRILLIYQLCREIWFHQIIFPLNIIGFLLEPIYLWLLRNNKVLTESNCTREDLMKYGFNKQNVHIIPVGIDINPINNLHDIKKYSEFTVLSLGAIRSMKLTLDQIKAFELAKKGIPELQMKMAGDKAGNYGEEVMRYIENSPYKKDIDYLGKVSKEKKIELMQKSHVILVTSVKEGWGLIVTEANSQGTPAIVYHSLGLSSSVKHNHTGFICQHNTPENLAENIIKLYKDPNLYGKLQKNAWKWSKELTFNGSYEEFKKFINNTHIISTSSLSRRRNL